MGLGGALDSSEYVRGLGFNGPIKKWGHRKKPQEKQENSFKQ